LGTPDLGAFDASMPRMRLFCFRIVYRGATSREVRLPFQDLATARARAEQMAAILGAAGPANAWTITVSDPDEPGLGSAPPGV
jgi:hypothetical protein